MGRGAFATMAAAGSGRVIAATVNAFSGAVVSDRIWRQPAID